MQSNKQIYQQIVDKFATTLSSQFQIENKEPNLDYIIAYCESNRDGFLPKSKLQIEDIESEVLKPFNDLEHTIERTEAIYVLIHNFFNAVAIALANRLSLESVIELEDEPLVFNDNEVIRQIDLLFHVVKNTQDPELLKTVEVIYNDIRYAIQQVVKNIQDNNYTLFYTDFTHHESKHEYRGIPYVVTSEYMFISYELILRHIIRYHEVIRVFNRNKAAMIDHKLGTVDYELLNLRRISSTPNEAIFRREAFRPEVFIQTLVSYSIADATKNLKAKLCQFYNEVIEKILEVKYPEEYARLQAAVAPLVEAYTSRVEPPMKVSYIIMYINELKTLGVNIDIIYEIAMKDLELCILTKVDKIKGKYQDLKGYKVEAKYIIDDNNILSTVFDVE